MDKIKITFVQSNISAIVELYNDKCPKNISNLLKVLPKTVKAFHAKWGGNEIWSVIENFEDYKHENETVLPSIGEIMLVPQTKGVCFDVWYDRGWAFGPNGFVQGSALGRITENLSQFAKQASKLSSEGAQLIKIEKV